MLARANARLREKAPTSCRAKAIESFAINDQRIPTPPWKPEIRSAKLAMLKDRASETSSGSRKLGAKGNQPPTVDDRMSDKTTRRLNTPTAPMTLYSVYFQSGDFKTKACRSAFRSV